MTGDRVVQYQNAIIGGDTVETTQLSRISKVDTQTGGNGAKATIQGSGFEESFKIRNEDADEFLRALREQIVEE